MPANKLIEKILDPHNAKQHLIFIYKKEKKITYQLKTFENPNPVDIKSLKASWESRF